MRDDDASGGVHAGKIAWAGAAIAAAVALAAGAAYLVWQPDAAAGAAPKEFGIAPPLLAAAPQPERAAYFAEKDKLLNSWAWVDRESGIARIPLDEAMRLTARRSAGGEQRP